MKTPAAPHAPTVPNPAGIPSRRVPSRGVTGRLAAASARRPRRVLAAWGLLVLASLAPGRHLPARPDHHLLCRRLHPVQPGRGPLRPATGGAADRQPTDVIVVSSKTSTAKAPPSGRSSPTSPPGCAPTPASATSGPISAAVAPWSRPGVTPPSSSCGRRPTPTSSRSSPPCRPRTAPAASPSPSPASTPSATTSPRCPQATSGTASSTSGCRSPSSSSCSCSVPWSPG